jgi:hypothetical protein
MFFKMDNQQQDNINNLKFKKVKDFPLYSVSNTGIVRNDKTNKNLSPRFLQGYKRVALCKNGVTYDKRIHRLVGIAFIPNPKNKPEINHKNGLRGDNNVGNLEWVTSKENQWHKVNVLGVGDKFKGEKNGNSKLSERDIRIIRNSTFSPKDLSFLLDIDIRHIKKILEFKLWKHVICSTTIERT